MRGEAWRRAAAVIVGVGIGTSIGLLGWPATRAATSEPSIPAAVASRVVNGSCYTRANCRGMIRGGLQITSTGWACTTGFAARNVRSGGRYVLTAGHCISGSGLQAMWSHGGFVIGRAALQGLHEGSSADVGAIDIGSTDTSDEIIGDGVDDIRLLTGSAPDGSQTIGTTMCRSAATSGWGCGRIIAADVDASINGIAIHHGWWIDIPSAAGDSGAPVVDTHGRAAGIAIATTMTATLYSTVDGIFAELGLRPCLDPACDY
jgi:hypothetical protein